jgi:hypothetical protein
LFELNCLGKAIVVAMQVGSHMELFRMNILMSRRDYAQSENPSELINQETFSQIQICVVYALSPGLEAMFVSLQKIIWLTPI